jgi:hypothetical protein
MARRKSSRTRLPSGEPRRATRPAGRRVTDVRVAAETVPGVRGVEDHLMDWRAWSSAE